MDIGKRLACMLLLLGNLALYAADPRVARLAVLYERIVGELSADIGLFGDNPSTARHLTELFEQAIAPFLVSGDVARYLFYFVALHYQGDTVDLAKDVRVVPVLGKLKKCDYAESSRVADAYWHEFGDMSLGWSERLAGLRKLVSLKKLLDKHHCVNYACWGYGFEFLLQLPGKINWAQWSLYLDQSPEKFVLFVPKTYVAKMSAATGATSVADAIGLAVDRSDIFRPVDLNKKTIGALITALDGHADETAPDLAKSFITFFNPRFTLAWNILLLGHGIARQCATQSVPITQLLKSADRGILLRSGRIAGMPASEFLKLMIFFNQLPSTSIVSYESCYGGGYNAESVKQVLAVAGGPRLYLVSLAPTDDVVQIIGGTHLNNFFDILEGGSLDDALPKVLDRIRQASAEVQAFDPIIVAPRRATAAEAGVQALAADRDLPAGVTAETGNFNIQNEEIREPWNLLFWGGGASIRSALPGDVEHRIALIKTDDLSKLLESFFNQSKAPGFLKIFTISKVVARDVYHYIVGDMSVAKPAIFEPVQIFSFPFYNTPDWLPMGWVIAATKDSAGTDWIIKCAASPRTIERCTKRAVKSDALAAELDSERKRVLSDKFLFKAVLAIRADIIAQIIIMREDKEKKWLRRSSLIPVLRDDVVAPDKAAQAMYKALVEVYGADTAAVKKALEGELVTRDEAVQDFIMRRFKEEMNMDFVAPSDEGIIAALELADKKGYKDIVRLLEKACPGILTAKLEQGLSIKNYKRCESVLPED